MSNPIGAGDSALAEEQRSDRVESRLASAFDEEMGIAAQDLASVSSKGAVPNVTSGRLSPRLALFGARNGHRRTRLLQIGAVAAVALLAATTILVPAFMRSPDASTTGRASPQVSPAISLDPARYDDGIPRTWQGELVLRGQAALDHASQSTDTTFFYIAFWYEPDMPHSCPPVGTGPDPLSCTDLYGVGDRAGVPWEPLGKALRIIDLRPPDGPVIARVHTHDPKWSHYCAPSELVACEHLMIGEAAVWTGDAATAPHPITVEQATAAFGAQETFMWGDCLAKQLPGVALLPFNMPGYPAESAKKGVIAVFPSVEALALAAPDAAARGESEAVPPGHRLDCAYNGIYSLRVYWLARANVLMGVYYDMSLGPQADPFVAEARSELKRLPAG